MININGQDYKFCLLDTNVVIEMVKNNSPEFLNFLEMMVREAIFPSLSIFTILELRQSPAIYQAFLELFTKIPCIIIKTLDQMFFDELNSYPNPKINSPVLVSFPGVLIPGAPTLKETLQKLFSEEEYLNLEKQWNDGKMSILEGILSLVGNYPPQNHNYSSKEIQTFLEIVVFSQIVRRKHEFATAMLEKNQVISIDAFPSLKMVAYSVFFKFYVDKRKPIKTDTFDLLITSLTPYMDIVITEGHFAEAIRKIKRLDTFLDGLEVYSLRELRRKREASKLK